MQVEASRVADTGPPPQPRAQLCLSPTAGAVCATSAAVALLASTTCTIFVPNASSPVASIWALRVYSPSLQLVVSPASEPGLAMTHFAGCRFVAPSPPRLSSLPPSATDQISQLILWDSCGNVGLTRPTCSTRQATSGAPVVPGPGSHSPGTGEEGANAEDRARPTTSYLPLAAIWLHPLDGATLPGPSQTDRRGADDTLCGTGPDPVCTRLVSHDDFQTKGKEGLCVVSCVIASCGHIACVCTHPVAHPGSAPSRLRAGGAASGSAARGTGGCATNFLGGQRGHFPAHAHHPGNFMSTAVSYNTRVAPAGTDSMWDALVCMLPMACAAAGRLPTQQQVLSISAVHDSWSPWARVAAPPPSTGAFETEAMQGAHLCHADAAPGAAASTPPATTVSVLLPPMPGLPPSVAFGDSKGRLSICPLAYASFTTPGPRACLSNFRCLLRGHNRPITCIHLAQVQRSVLPQTLQEQVPDRGAHEVKAPGAPALSADMQSTPQGTPTEQTDTGRSRWRRSAHQPPSAWSSESGAFSFKTILSHLKLPKPQDTLPGRPATPVESPVFPASGNPDKSTIGVTTLPLPLEHSTSGLAASLAEHLPALSLASADPFGTSSLQTNSHLPLDVPHPQPAAVAETPTSHESILLSGCESGRVCAWLLFRGPSGHSAAASSLPRIPSADKVHSRMHSGSPRGVLSPWGTIGQLLFSVDALPEPVLDVVLPTLQSPSPWLRCERPSLGCSGFRLFHA
jgi:hypothetical protein